MSALLKRLHNRADKQSDDDAESDSKKSRPLLALGIFSDANYLLTEDETGQNTLLNSRQSQDDMLDNIFQSVDETDRTAKPVSDKLANFANKSWLHKPSDDQLKTKIEKYHHPVYCGKVVVPKVYEDIWRKLPMQAREKDLKFSRLQSIIAKVGYIAVKSTDLLLKLKASDDSTIIAKF